MNSILLEVKTWQTQITFPPQKSEAWRLVTFNLLLSLTLRCQVFGILGRKTLEHWPKLGLTSFPSLLEPRFKFKTESNVSLWSLVPPITAFISDSFSFLRTDWYHICLSFPPLATVSYAEKQAWDSRTAAVRAANLWACGHLGWMTETGLQCIAKTFRSLEPQQCILMGP